MVSARDFYSKTGRGVCLIKDGKIVETYLLGEEEVIKIERIFSALSAFPPDFETGIVEFDENSKFGIFRISDYLLIFPVRTENFADIIRIRGTINVA